MQLPYVHQLKRYAATGALLALALITGVQPILAAPAEKSILEAGPFKSGETVTVQIKFDKPAVTVTPSVELVAVVDTSQSIAPAMTDFKSKLSNFVSNSLSKYPGAVRVGITKIGNGTASFDSNNANNPYANYPMYPTNPYSNTPRPNSAVGIDKVVAIDAGNIGALQTAISQIAPESTNNPEYLDGYPSQQGDQVNSYTSDIGAGMQRASEMFTSDPGMERFIILLTDGEVNRSYCPINNDGTPRINIHGAQLQVLPSNTNTGQYLPVYPSDDTTFPSYRVQTYGEPAVCGQFNLNFFGGNLLTDNVAPHYNSSKPNTSILKEIANRYGGIRSEDIQTNTLDKVVAAAKISMITLQDQLNSSVFSSVSFPSGGLTNCSGTSLGSPVVTVSGTSITVISDSSAIATTSTYCLQLKATITSSPPSGLQKINTDSGNSVVFKDGNGKEVANVVIGNADIEIVAHDVVADELTLRNDAGVARNVFTTSQNIFFGYRVRNTSSVAWVPNNAVSQMFTHAPSTVAPNTVGDNGTSIVHGWWAPSEIKNYESWPGGNYNDLISGPKSWTKSAGDYVARGFLNYQTGSGPVIEQNYDNNQVTRAYSVITPPTQQPTTNVTCSSATVNWNAGSSNITGYKVNLSPADGGPYPKSVARTSSSLPLTNLQESTTYTWTLIASTINGDYTVPSGPNSTFTTQPCPHFDVSVSNPTSVNPGSTQDAYTTYNISYLPDNSYWNPATDNVTLAIRRFEFGTYNCEGGGLAAQGPKDDGNTDGGRVTARFTTGSDTQLQVPALTTTGTLTLKADATATIGRYTLCLGAWSNNSTDERIRTVIVNLDMTAWLQVAGPRAGSQGAGDVHSNGPFSNLVIPSNPVQQYFFLTGSTGVVSSGSTIGINPSNRITSLFSNGWASRNYPSTNVIKTPEYVGMVEDLERKGDEESLSNNAKLLDNNSCNNGQSKNFHVSGNASLDKGTTITFPSGCDGVQYNYFIDGNLYVRSNVVDETQRGTLVFIVNGDIVLDSDISRIDGVYMFGGRFMNGSSATQLVVNGSLLGLAGTSPSAGTGSFVQSGGVTGLQRDLGADDNATTPAEIIYYQPKYLYLLKDSVISGSIFSWTE